MTSSYFNLLVKGTGIEVVSTHTCKYCGDEYALYDVEQKLYDEQGMRYSEVCSVCIFRMLYSYINDRHLYHRLDFRTGKKIVSVISEAYTESEVLDAVEYNQLATDDMGLEYGQQLGEDSFGQFKKLYRSFPKYARMIYDCPENSLYSSHVGWSKNLYLSFCVFEECENIYYSFRILGNAKRIFSSIDVSESSDVYLSRMVANAHDVAYSSNISESNAVFWSKNLQNCHHCAFCCNLVGASYKIFNTQYTKEEYETAYEDILNRLQDPGQFHLLQKRYEEFLSEHLIEPALNIQNSEQVVGDNIYFSSKNINSFRGF
ncbi:MAG: hypothetical protein H6767_03560 [Candidatus Peribacteria bacterium]|nr:MAG: hypothetical protein H6767_03560 [Candidatus Peribacteria bacterium]